MNPKQTLSANTLFHFTNSSEKLESILMNEFWPAYSLEDWGVFFPGLSEVAIPMVCFCDIPLSQIGKHTGYYGSYAVGLTKKWGMTKNISPVLYIHKQARSSTHLRTIFLQALQHPCSTGEEEFSPLTQDFIKFLKFLKPYQGKLRRNGRLLKNKITFYDEREWRFCPDIPFSRNENIDQPRCFLSKQEMIRGERQELLLGGTIDSQKELLKRYKLSFKPTDIRYIIVKKESEILGMVRKIQDIKQKYRSDDLQILTTRIISMEHIFEDF